jgi:hypothetical protein
MSYVPPAANAVNFDLKLYIPPGGGFSFRVYNPPDGDSCDFELVPFPRADFNFEKTKKGTFLMGFGMSKRLGRPEWADPLNVYGIYQMRMTRRGKVPIKMRFYRPTDPKTELQQANRQKFADAMQAWQDLTSEVKADYTRRARARGMLGHNLFIKQYYSDH